MATESEYDALVNYFLPNHFNHIAVLFHEFKNYPLQTMLDELSRIQWIKKRNAEYYDLTQACSDFCKNLPEAFIGKPYSYFKLKQKEAQKKEAYVSELEFEQLKSNVEKLRNDLTNFKPSNRRANIAIFISIISTAIAAVMLYLKWIRR